MAATNSLHLNVERLKAEVVGLEASAQQLRESLIDAATRLLGQVGQHAADHQRFTEMVGREQSQQSEADELAAGLVGALPSVVKLSAEVSDATAVLRRVEAAIAARTLEIERLQAQAAAALSQRSLH